MIFRDLRAFMAELDRRGDLVRVAAEVDSDQEIAVIQQRVMAAGGPALLFENVKGSPYRLVGNLYGSKARVELALGQPLAGTMEEPLRSIESGPVLAERFEPANLMQLPVLKCCPLDGGHFFTLPLVQTSDPETGIGNLGIYRMHRYDGASAGMHWNGEKGGGLHFKKAVARGERLPVSVVLGGPPALTLAAIAPLPDGVDERAFAVQILGEPLEVLDRRTTGHRVPAQAEFILEGGIVVGDVRREGPLGDHFGHYSYSGDCPVFRVDRVLARKDAIYPTTVVGRPPQEDYFIGNALQELSRSLNGMADAWSYSETGFEPLTVVAMKSGGAVPNAGNYPRAKMVIVVDAGVNVRDFHAVSRALRENLDPAADLSRLVWVATRQTHAPLRPAPLPPPQPAAVHPGIRALRALGEGVLMVQVSKDWNRDGIQNALAGHPITKQYVLQVAVSEDVDIEQDVLALWGWFLRFDPGADIHPARGGRILPLLIDATWKAGHRQPVVFDPKIEQRVNDKWDSYGIKP